MGYRKTIRGPFPNWSTTKAIPMTRNAAVSVEDDINNDDGCALLDVSVNAL